MFAKKRPPDEGWKGIFYSNPEDPGIAGAEAIWYRLDVEFRQPMVVGCAGIDTFCCGPAICLVCSNFASAAIAWQEIGGI